MNKSEINPWKHLLPALPYHHTALEPHIDTQTMTLHHGKHHAAYVENLNSVLEKFPELHQRNALWLLLNLSKVPQKIRAAVRNNAGGHVNHSLFWQAMSPPTSGAPAGSLADAIKRDFGSFEQFKIQFADAGKAIFGSGWVWLVRTQQDGGKLQIYPTSGHDNPLMQGHYPILLNDVWEHAYYLKYKNRRGDYLKSWWPIVNWEVASQRFESSDHTSEYNREYKGASILRAAL